MSISQGHQQRVIDELADLDSKLTRLHVFIVENGPVFQSQSIGEKRRLREQKIHMENYASVLRDRIAAFK